MLDANRTGIMHVNLSLSILAFQLTFAYSGTAKVLVRPEPAPALPPPPLPPPLLRIPKLPAVSLCLLLPPAVENAVCTLTTVSLIHEYCDVRVIFTCLQGIAIFRRPPSLLPPTLLLPLPLLRIPKLLAAPPCPLLLPDAGSVACTLITVSFSSCYFRHV